MQREDFLRGRLQPQVHEHPLRRRRGEERRHAGRVLRLAPDPLVRFRELVDGVHETSGGDRQPARRVPQVARRLDRPPVRAPLGRGHRTQSRVDQPCRRLKRPLHPPVRTEPRRTLPVRAAPFLASGCGTLRCLCVVRSGQGIVLSYVWKTDDAPDTFRSVSNNLQP
jgi:hypothetical protein